MIGMATSQSLKVKRTTSGDPDFATLVRHLDHELWNELEEDQATYDQYNKVPGIDTALVVYLNEQPVAIGCFKPYDKQTVEIKRMFVEKQHRGRGLSSLVLKELETWASGLGYGYAILETSVHFEAARALYSHAGYEVIDNYDQYEGLTESVCMRKALTPAPPSEFKNLRDVEYFLFEEDFIEKNIRCIPMIVRFKMDLVGIKLKLAEWSRLTIEERTLLATRPCDSPAEKSAYDQLLSAMVRHHTGRSETRMSIEDNPEWNDTEQLPSRLRDKLDGFGWQIRTEDWKSLTALQRFALLKLCRKGHENKNFPKAMREFGLVEN